MTTLILAVDVGRRLLHSRSRLLELHGEDRPDRQPSELETSRRERFERRRHQELDR